MGKAKKCSKCGKVKSIEKFFKDKYSKDGLHSSCKTCDNKQRKKYYKNNKELIKKKAKEKRISNPEIAKEKERKYYLKYRAKCIIKTRKYYELNKEKLNILGKARREKNKKEAKEYYKKYSKNFPEKRRVLSRVYKATKTDKLVRVNRCSYCGKICKSEAHHWDYSKPLEVVWLCKSHHRRLHGELKQLNKEKAEGVHKKHSEVDFNFLKNVKYNE